jgi:hypothetical protein
MEKRPNQPACRAPRKRQRPVKSVDQKRRRTSPQRYKDWVVTCTNGHEVVEIARSLKHKDVIEPSAFVNWRPGYLALKL